MQDAGGPSVMGTANKDMDVFQNRGLLIRQIVEYSLHVGPQNILLNNFIRKVEREMVTEYVMKEKSS